MTTPKDDQERIADLEAEIRDLKKDNKQLMDILENAVELGKLGVKAGETKLVNYSPYSAEAQTNAYNLRYRGN